MQRVINNWTRNIGLLAATKEQIDKAKVYVPDDLVLRITATGTPDEARAQVHEYIDRGATCPILYPLGDVELMIDTFATE